jgi:hypothetical protein
VASQAVAAAAVSDGERRTRGQHPLRAFTRWPSRRAQDDHRVASRPGPNRRRCGKFRR